jgi:hypothetical protein
MCMSPAVAGFRKNIIRIIRAFPKYHVSSKSSFSNAEFNTKVKRKYKYTAVLVVAWIRRCEERKADGAMKNTEGHEATADRPMNPATWPYAVVFLLQCTVPFTFHTYVALMQTISQISTLVSHFARKFIPYRKGFLLLPRVTISRDWIF